MGKESTKVYRREVSDIGSWREFSVPHVAFALHRVTGWLLLGWVGYHLVVPMLTGASTSVQPPSGNLFTVAVLSVLFFHGINGLRLLVVEFSSRGVDYIEQLFKGTVVATGLTAVLTWVVI